MNEEKQEVAQVKSGELSLSEAPSTFNAIKSVSPLPSHLLDLSNHTCSRPLVQPLALTFGRRRGKAGRDEPSGLNGLPPSAEVSSRWRQAPHPPRRTKLRRNHNSLDLR